MTALVMITKAQAMLQLGLISRHCCSRGRLVFAGCFIGLHVALLLLAWLLVIGSRVSRCTCSALPCTAGCNCTEQQL